MAIKNNFIQDILAWLSCFFWYCVYCALLISALMGISLHPSQAIVATALTFHHLLALNLPFDMWSILWRFTITASSASNINFIYKDI